MACNWAYDNPPTNRIVWWIVITITVIGKILIATGIIGGYADQDCFHKYNDCRKDFSTDYCSDKYQEVCKIKTWTGLIIAGVVIWVFGACFTSYFCCCSNPVPPDPQAIALQPMNQQPYPQGAPGGYPAQTVAGVPLAGYPPNAYPPEAYAPQGGYAYPPQGGYPSQGPYAPQGGYPNQGPYAAHPGAWGPPPVQQTLFQPPEMTTATVVSPPPSGAAPTTATAAAGAGAGAAAAGAPGKTV